LESQQLHSKGRKGRRGKLSLNWDITKCADSDSLVTEDEWPTTHRLIFRLMAIGMNGLKDEADVKEAFIRIKLDDRFYNEYDGEETFTVSDLRKRIGINTNVRTETRLQWWKRLLDYYGRTAESGYRNEVRKIREAAEQEKEKETSDVS